MVPHKDVRNTVGTGEAEAWLPRYFAKFIDESDFTIL